jgi:hypothetical protein
MTVYPAKFLDVWSRSGLLASARFAPSKATRHHREIRTMTMITRTKTTTKKTKIGPMNRRSCANRTKTSR